MERDAALTLLREHHEFPGDFQFRIVVRPGYGGTAVAAMAATAGGDATVRGVRERPSRNGTYVALAITMYLPDAERVLDVYEVLRALDGVVTSL